MLRDDFMFADSTTDFILVIFDDSSLLIGVQVWSLIFYYVALVVSNFLTVPLSNRVKIKSVFFV